MNTSFGTSLRPLLYGFLVLAVTACNNSNNKPDVSGIKADVNMLRFDKDFFSMDTTQLESSLQALNKKYPSFLPLYTEFLSPINMMVRQEGRSFGEAIKLYYRTIKPLYNAVEKKYSNLDAEEKEIEKGLKYVKYYFPEFKTPAAVASVESYNPDDPQEIYGTIYYHDTLIISLQMFMGKDFPEYDPAQYPDYLRRRFEREFIVPNAFRSLASAVYPDTSQTASLIEQMVEKGKQWYLLDKFLPDTPDSLKTGYSKTQTEFIRENEGNIWSQFLKDTPDPYTLDQERLKNYLGEGPFTQDMPHDLKGNGTPGNIGQWIGSRIVHKYASEHTKMSVQQILATPAKQIFQQAGYRPK